MRIAISETHCLTEFRHSDRQDCVRWISDREIYVRTLRVPHPYTESHFDEWMRIVEEATERYRGPTHFAIREGDTLIGGIGVAELIEGHRAELGYWLARPWWGQGIMTLAAGVFCEHALATWNLTRITAHVFEFNVASARVLEKNAFQFEGLLRKHYLKDGEFLNGRLYARVR